MKISKWSLGAAVALALCGRSAVAQQYDYGAPATSNSRGAAAVIEDDAAYATPPVSAALAGYSTMAAGEDPVCPPDDECAPPEPFELFPKTCRGIKIGGWTQLGTHTQESYADYFNQNPGTVHLHQQYMYIERQLEAECGLDFGFRFDAIYGIDANNTQAFGNPPGTWDYQNGFDFGAYGWALPQLYAEIGNKELSAKIGHFYTPLGYEVVTATGNFFYSHSFTMNNSEPFTHTGVLGKWVANDKLTAYGGWTLGWDTGFTNLNQGNNFIGGLSYKLMDEVTFTYLATGGNLGHVGRDGYSHSLVVDVLLTEKWQYVFQSDLLSASNPVVRPFYAAPGEDLSTIGINQYLFYTINDQWKAGARVEWWNANGTSVNAATVGVNWKPHTNLVFRPEYKHEWIPEAGLSQNIFGIDAILTY